MPDPIVDKAQQWLVDHSDELLENTRALLRFPSLQEPADHSAKAPFGKPLRETLDWCLELCRSWGRPVTDLDGYIGYTDFGDTGPLILVLGHIDVVPVGNGWTYEPFGATIDNGYIYARGAVDDKGPTMASLYAARAVFESNPNLNARIRVVFGCNEESGFECVKYYKEKDEMPVLGVAPDSGWPCYHAEKGIADIFAHWPLSALKETQIHELNSGERANVVPDRCTLKFSVNSEHKTAVEAGIAKYWDKNVTVTPDGDGWKIEAVGKSAHGSTPYFGDSAVGRAVRSLLELAPDLDKPVLAEFLSMIDPSAAGLGISGDDFVAGPTTNNLGIARSKSEYLELTFNIRYPVTWKGDEMLQRAKDHFSSLRSKPTVANFSDSPSLYFPLDHPLVEAIVDAYEEETGERKKPGSMGGGTYARALPNTVSIGTGWDGDGLAHEPDERLAVEHLHKMARIYSNIIHRLTVLAK